MNILGLKEDDDETWFPKASQTHEADVTDDETGHPQQTPESEKEARRTIVSRRIDAELATMAMLDRYVPNDTLVLSDEILIGAIKKVRPLTRGQYSKLLESPLTLRRMKRLLQKLQTHETDITDFNGPPENPVSELIGETRKRIEDILETPSSVPGGNEGVEDNTESPYYKDVEIAALLLGRSLDFRDKEYILDHPNTESIITFSDDEAKNDGLVQERIQIYINQFLNADFTLKEIRTLIENGVLIGKRNQYIVQGMKEEGFLTDESKI